MNYPTIIKNRLNKLMTNLSKNFVIDKLSKSPARFNLAKLEWFNKEYLKMMSLEEFAWRANSLKLKNSLKLGKKEIENDEKKPFRIGDYVFLVDIEKNKIFGGFSTQDNFASEFFYPVGGGRENGLESIVNLQKEITEELGGQLELEVQKLIKIADFRIEYPMAGFCGVDFNLYFYPISVENLQNCTENENGIISQFQWFELENIITNGKLINYPIWRNFCFENKLKCFEPNLQILQQYLAWNLDKNRVTKLDQVG
jgi:hypothetical protein